MFSRFVWGMSDDASFTSHVHHVCSKVKQKAGWILRTFQSRNTQVMKFLWKSLIQGHIDYCSQLYLPSKSNELQQIENLQKWYTEKIPELQHLDYWSRIRTIHMYSQQTLMERYRIIYAWKILEGLAPNCGLNVQSSERRGVACTPAQRQDHSQVLYKSALNCSMLWQNQSGTQQKSQ